MGVAVLIATYSAALHGDQRPLTAALPFTAAASVLIMDGIIGPCRT